MKISMVLFGALLLAEKSDAQIRANRQLSANHQTARYVLDFSRVAEQRGSKFTELEIHTYNIAKDHREMRRDWSRNGRWPRILSCARDSVDSKCLPKPNATSVIRISWYAFENAAFTYEIDNNGRVETASSSYETFNGRPINGLKPREMGRLSRLMAQLPRSVRVIDRRDILMVSSRRNGRWILRMYSRRHKPLALQQILRDFIPSGARSSLRP